MLLAISWSCSSSYALLSLLVAGSCNGTMTTKASNFFYEESCIDISLTSSTLLNISLSWNNQNQCTEYNQDYQTTRNNLVTRVWILLDLVPVKSLCILAGCHFLHVKQTPLLFIILKVIDLCLINIETHENEFLKQGPPTHFLCVFVYHRGVMQVDRSSLRNILPAPHHVSFQGMFVQ